MRNMFVFFNKKQYFYTLPTSVTSFLSSGKSCCVSLWDGAASVLVAAVVKYDLHIML